MLSRRMLITGAASSAALFVLPAAAQAAGSKGLSALERDHGVRIGAYALDVASGRTVRHRGGEPFPLLATYRVLAAGALLGKTDGKVADDALLEEAGGPGAVTAYVRTLGDPITRLDRPEPGLLDWSPTERRDTTTADAMGHDLRFLLKSAGHDRLLSPGAPRLGLASAWSVSGSGTTYGTTADVAVVAAPGASSQLLAIYVSRPAADARPDQTLPAEVANVLVSALRNA